MMEERKQNVIEEEKEKLPLPWQRIQGAVWLIGLAIIAWKDWWWPGILVLVAISGLTQAAIQFYLSRQEKTQQQSAQEKQLEKERAEWLPDVCPNCGGPLSVSTVHWSSSSTADCPYCKANLKKPS
jgi:membrane protein implicated in regulation of membrane protease activity